MGRRTFPATVVEVHDGDTLRVSADLGFDTWRLVDVRLNRINAIELADPGGIEARDHLAALLRPYVSVTLLSLGWDKYGGRVSGQITLPDGRDVSALMIADGYAALWNGHGPRPVPPWPIPAPASS